MEEIPTIITASPKVIFVKPGYSLLYWGPTGKGPTGRGPYGSVSSVEACIEQVLGQMGADI